MREESHQSVLEIPFKWARQQVWRPKITCKSVFRSAFKKHFVLLFLTLLMSGNMWALDPSHALWTQTLKSHVQDESIDYRKLKQKSIDLEIYLKSLSNTPQSEFDQWAKEPQIAYLVNLYNAATVQLILDEYPIKSIKDIGFLPHAAWRKKFISLWGKKISLNHLEHEIIRPRTKHLPAVHFALVCAAKGCPPLRAEAYTGSSLTEQLNDQGRIFLSNPSKNRISKNDQTLHLSPIFDWYADDFERISGTVQSYLAENFPEQFQKDLTGYSIRYTHYDWSLNEVQD